VGTPLNQVLVVLYQLSYERVQRLFVLSLKLLRNRALERYTPRRWSPSWMDAGYPTIRRLRNGDINQTEINPQIHASAIEASFASQAP